MHIHLGSYGSIDSSLPNISGSVGGGSFEGVEDWEYIRCSSTATTISTEGITYLCVGTCQLCSKFYLLCYAALLKILHIMLYFFTYYAKLCSIFYSPVPMLCYQICTSWVNSN